MLLTRQDSNLDPLNQNQWCYQLHYGSMESVRAEGFEPPVPGAGNCFTGSRDKTVVASHAASLAAPRAGLEPTVAD